MRECQARVSGCLPLDESSRFSGLRQCGYLETMISFRRERPRFCVLHPKATGIVTLTAGAQGLGSNPGEDMDVCKCKVPLRQGGILNSRRAASPLVWLVEGEEWWEAPSHLQGFLPLIWGETDQNCTVTCMVLKAKANDRRENSSP
ncbi:uncharacterized protein TNCV_4560301 [Trichonephila clavipes]|nr:uncharacterized protein TNCV_4560301 [Trichonephila clavipes]